VAASFGERHPSGGFFQLSVVVSDLHTMAGITGMPVAPSSMGGIGSAMSGANGGDNIQSIMNGTYGKAMVRCPRLLPPRIVLHLTLCSHRTGVSHGGAAVWCATVLFRDSHPVASNCFASERHRQYEDRTGWNNTDAASHCDSVLVGGGGQG